MYKHVNVNFCINTQLFTYKQYYCLVFFVVLVFVSFKAFQMKMASSFGKGMEV